MNLGYNRDWRRPKRWRGAVRQRGRAASWGDARNVRIAGGAESSSTVAMGIPAVIGVVARNLQLGDPAFGCSTHGLGSSERNLTQSLLTLWFDRVYRA
jgi:hypothetical protein